MPPQTEPLKNVLVTGGSGFYGHHLIAFIHTLEPTCTIYALDIVPPRPSRQYPNATYLTSTGNAGYSLSKGVAETDVLAHNCRPGKTPMLTCALRPCTTFGPDDEAFFTNIVDVVRKGQAKYRFGTGRNLFDFIYIGNACHAHIVAASTLLTAYTKPIFPADKRVEGEVFNITNAEPIPFWDLTLWTAVLMGRPVADGEIVQIPLWVSVGAGRVAEWAV
ncbi:NAD(P)-binding protein [Bimuria novae-zelandiae CBS 107.79]|uniref:NAD(P)-binding protein n=1 Tax=Bimuria novae-zelandiae CBS 107.79 TaxID=1447943 RepID=A0A6A5V2W5_9PLEO|nr:NAD(P)-binding protein [Bimuria novae-zelandiae CBS 107.79]